MNNATAEQIKRRRMLAQAITQESMDPLQSQMAGGRVVPISPWQGVAKLGQALIGGAVGRKADQEERAYQDQSNARLAAALQNKDYSSLATDPVYGPAVAQAQITQGMQDQNRPRLLQPNELPAGMTPNPNAQYFGVNGNVTDVKPIPKDDSLTPDLKNYKAAQDGGYKGSFMDYQKDLKTAAAQVRIDNPSSPKAPSGYTFTPEGTLTAIPGGPADLQSKLKPIPPAQNTAIIENQKALQNIQAAEDAINASMQTDPSALGAWNFLPDAIRQRTDPQGVNVRSQLAKIGGQQFHDISGAAVSASEAERLKPYIPNATDDPKTALAKLQNLRREYENVNGLIGQTYSKEQGYIPNPILGGNVPQGTSNAPKFLGFE